MCLRPRFNSSIWLWLVVLSLTAQSQVSDPQITGRVVRRDNGAPIAGASIELSSPFVFGNRELQTATTDVKGEYRFQGLKEGVFTVRASAKGFVPQTYRPGASAESEFQRINTSSRLRGIDFHLISEAVIKGVITNVKGEPVGEPAQHPASQEQNTG